MCGVRLDFPQPGQHCPGCQCFTRTWGTSTTLTITNPYQPKHRKPGPAQ